MQVWLGTFLVVANKTLVMEGKNRKSNHLETNTCAKLEIGVVTVVILQISS